jgi:uncharacterized protein (DUF3084 family)
MTDSGSYHRSPGIPVEENVEDLSLKIDLPTFLEEFPLPTEDGGMQQQQKGSGPDQGARQMKRSRRRRDQRREERRAQRMRNQSENLDSLDEKDAEIARLGTLLGLKDQQIAQLDRVNLERDLDLLQMRRESHKTRQQLQRLRQELNQASQVSSLENSLLWARYRYLLSEYMTLQLSEAATFHAMETNRAELQRVLAQLRRARAGRRRVRDELEAVQAELTDAHGELDAFEAELAGVREELREVRDESDEVLDELEMAEDGFNRRGDVIDRLTNQGRGLLDAVSHFQRDFQRAHRSRQGTAMVFQKYVPVFHAASEPLRQTILEAEDVGDAVSTDQDTQDADAGSVQEQTDQSMSE